MKYFIVFIIMATSASAETLLTVANNGTVSVIKGLTALECKSIKNRLDPYSEENWPVDKDGRQRDFILHDGDITRVECLK